MLTVRDMLYFIILLGVLVFVHELGHFLWAKIFNVKVLKFSLGFGPRLVGFRKGETEYLLSAVPLGGYVKMLGEGPEGGDGVSDEVPEDERPRPEDRGRALGDKPLWQRAIILVGGPAMNLLFPILIYFVVFLGRGEIPPASVGTVFAGKPAAEAGLQPGDIIVSIDGEPTPGFEDVVAIVEDNPDTPLVFRIRRDDQEFERTITPYRAPKVLPVLGAVDEVGRIGFSPVYRAPVIGPPGAAGEAAGLRTFDEIRSLDGKPVRRFIDLERTAVPAGGTVAVGLLRPETVPTGLGTVAVNAPLRLDPALPPGTPLARALDLADADLVVSQVEPGSAADRGGLRPGDRLLRFDGRPLITWDDARISPETAPAGDHALVVRRGAEQLELTVTLTPHTVTDAFGNERQVFRLGAGGYARTSEDDLIPNPNRVSRAFFGAFAETWNTIRLTGLGFAAIFTGRVGVDSLGGPVLIFDVASQSAEAGATTFLFAMALISINLGLLNLLPIPVLDGGHLVFFAIEAIRRKPIPRRVREIAQTVGLVLILALVALALRNDLARKWGDIVGFFGG